MNAFQKHRIVIMRGSGATYAVIAAELDLSESTVKSHCRRQGISTVYEFCPECGVGLAHLPKKKPKRFCSDKCRMAWWAKNPEAVNRQAVYNHICLLCRKPFTAYGNAKRKYCSLICAVAARGEGEADGNYHQKQTLHH